MYVSLHGAVNSCKERNGNCPCSDHLGPGVPWGMPKKKERKNGCSCKAGCPCHKSRTVQDLGVSTAKVVESRRKLHWLHNNVLVFMPPSHEIISNFQRPERLEWLWAVPPMLTVPRSSSLGWSVSLSHLEDLLLYVQDSSQTQHCRWWNDFDDPLEYRNSSNNNGVIFSW